MSRYWALDFDGTPGSFLTYPIPPQWIGSGSFSVSFWVRATPDLAKLPAGNCMWLLQIGNQAANESMFWSVFSNRSKPGTTSGHFGFLPAYDAKQPQLVNALPFDPYLNKWAFVTTSFDAATQTLTSYMNGQIVDSKVVPEGILKPRAPGVVAIGSGTKVPGVAIASNPTAQFDDVRVWDVALQQAQILRTMYLRLSVPTDHLVSYLNVPGDGRTGADTGVAVDPGLVDAVLTKLRDRVTNEQVDVQRAVSIMPTSIPNGAPGCVPDERQIALFQEASYQENAWRLGSADAGPDVRTDLTPCGVSSLRVGEGTCARFFAETSYRGSYQETMSSLPGFDPTKLGKAPLSVQVLPTEGREHRGDWAILTSANQYLGAKPEAGGELPLRCYSTCDGGLFRVETLGKTQVSVKLTTSVAYLRLGTDGRLDFGDPEVSDRSRWTKVRETDDVSFSLKTASGAWVAVQPDGGFGTSDDEADREVFRIAFYAGEDETQVGELCPGEVAFYEKHSYWGKSWVFTSSQPDLRPLGDLKPASIRLGPHTGISLFTQPHYEEGPDKQGSGIVADTLDLGATDIQSFRFWRVVSPASVGLESVTTLSQDYRGAKPFSAYRTSLGVPQNVQTVYVGALDETKVEVAGKTYTLGSEGTPIPVSVFSKLIITSEADHLFTAGLTIRTDTMAEGQKVVLFPDREAHAKLRDMKGDDFYHATVDGKPIRKNGVTKADARAVQSLIQGMMAMTDTSQVRVNVKAPDARDGCLLGSARAGWKWATHTRTLTTEHMEKPWQLRFERSGVKAGRAEDGALGAVFTQHEEHELEGIWDDTVEAVALTSTRDFWNRLWNADEEIVHVVIKKVKDAVNQLAVQIEYAVSGIKKFVVKTVAEAAAVAERIFHEVVKAVGKVIEWLSFLFDWDDILATQRELTSKINEALDLAKQKIVNVQHDVDGWIEKFQKELNGAFGSLKTHLEQRPLTAPARASASGVHTDAAEKQQWFMDKMLGSQDAQGGPVLALALDPGVGEQFQEFFNEARAAVESILKNNVRKNFSDALTQLSAAFSDTNERVDVNELVLGLLSLLEALSDVAIQLVKAVIDLIFGLVEKLVDWVKTALNQDFPIPIVKDLWDVITTDAAGHTVPFSILNVVTLAVAIPTTIAYKAVTGQSPASVFEPAAEAAPVRLQGTLGGQAVDPDYGKKLLSAIGNSFFTLVDGVLSVPLDAASAGEMVADPVDPGVELWNFSDIGPVPPIPPVPTKPGWATTEVSHGGLLEVFAWSAGLGSVVLSWPGGYPLAKPSAAPFFDPNDLPEFMGDLTWSYDVLTTIIDGISLLVGGHVTRRVGNQAMVVFDSVLGALGLGLNIVTIGAELTNKSPWYVTHVWPEKSYAGVIGTYPDFLSFLILPELTEGSEGVTLAAYLCVERLATVVETATTFGMGVAGLIDPVETKDGTVDFGARPTTGAAPLTVAFSDASAAGVTSWTWDFGDGASSTEQNPIYEYTEPKTYTVKLTANGTDWSKEDTASKPAFITVSEPAHADFGGSPTSGAAPLTVGFRDLSTGGITRWVWDFGDGTRSREQNPTHEYAAAGTYTVTLTVAGPGGADQVVKAAYVVVGRQG